MTRRVPFGCPRCGSHAAQRVTDSRMKADYIWRRRECEVCGVRYTTREVVVDDDATRLPTDDVLSALANCDSRLGAIAETMESVRLAVVEMEEQR
jgi:transcriptional regulator NrdR family protein